SRGEDVPGDHEEEKDEDASKGVCGSQRPPRANDRAAGEEDEAREDDRQRPFREDGRRQREPQRPSPPGRRTARAALVSLTFKKTSLSPPFSKKKHRHEREHKEAGEGGARLDERPLPPDDRRARGGRPRDERLAGVPAAPGEERGREDERSRGERG